MLGRSHKEVVEMLKSVPMGQSVDVVLRRGYPMLYNPDGCPKHTLDTVRSPLNAVSSLSRLLRHYRHTLRLCQAYSERWESVRGQSQVLTLHVSYKSQITVGKVQAGRIPPKFYSDEINQVMIQSEKRTGGPS